MTGAFITGCAGLELTGDERAFMGETRPWGLILFRRNVSDSHQIADLAAGYRELTGQPDAPVLIDQEGGRVQRMGPPNWLKYPAGRAYAELYEADPVAALKAVRLVYRLMADDLTAAGVNVDCVPVLDVPQPGAHEIIGDRAYGRDPASVALVARAASEGLLAGGVLPVIKHIPGHGRAGADSHLALPVVNAPVEDLRATDFAPFAACADLPMAMTAHVVYSALDADAPATLSARIIGGTIRQDIGYDGLIMTDDLSMKALDFAIPGTTGANYRSSMHARGEIALAAGCDVLLHCNGELAEMRQVAEAAGELSGVAARRAAQALAHIRPAEAYDRDEAVDWVNRLLPSA